MLRNIILSVLGVIGTTLVHMLAKLFLNENFIRKVVILLLEKLVAKSNSDVEKQLLEIARQEWAKE